MRFFDSLVQRNIKRSFVNKATDVVQQLFPVSRPPPSPENRYIHFPGRCRWQGRKALYNIGKINTVALLTLKQTVWMTKIFNRTKKKTIQIIIMFSFKANRHFFQNLFFDSRFFFQKTKHLMAMFSGSIFIHAP